MGLIRRYFGFLYAIGFVNRRMGVGRFWGFVISHWAAVFMIDGAGAETLAGVLQFAMLVLTGLSIVQRFNDAGLQRGLIILIVIPYIGWLIMFFLLFSASEAAVTRYGPPGVHTESQLSAIREKA